MLQCLLIFWTDLFRFTKKKKGFKTNSQFFFNPGLIQRRKLKMWVVPGSHSISSNMSSVYYSFVDYVKCVNGYKKTGIKNWIIMGRDLFFFLIQWQKKIIIPSSYSYAIVFISSIVVIREYNQRKYTSLKRYIKVLN